MSPWLRKHFSDVAHARRALLTMAIVLGVCGFTILMIALLER
jgi:hypothetical protein